jgi:hypothetical protein
LVKRVTITLQDIQTLRPAAEIDGQRWEPYALEAQDQDLRPILGDGLYYDFMTKWYSTGDAMYTAYQNLLNGTTYTYNGQTIYFDGLKPMIVYFTLARFVQNNPIHVTRFGIVMKTTNNSQNVDPVTLRQVVSELRSNAVTYKNQVDTYLLQNQSTYTLYIGSESAVTTSFKMFKG